MCFVALLDFRLAAARLREGERVFGQLSTIGCLAHAREELQAEIRRLPEHVDEHEAVGSGFAHSRHARNTFALEDGTGFGKHRGILGIVVGCQECLNELFYAR